MDNVQKEKLLNEFRSLVDEATILSISSDYDLKDPEGFSAAQHTLLAISENVEAEEATGFNPSGIGAGDVVGSHHSNQEENEAEASRPTSSDVTSTGGFTTTTDSSLMPTPTSAESKLYANENPDFYFNVFDGLNKDEKEHRLTQMFVSLKPIDVKFALQKSKGDAYLAIDELLSLQWLEQTDQRPKGIDGFDASADDQVRPKKKKSRKQRKAAAKARAATAKSTAKDSTENDVVDDQITLISNRLGLALPEAATIYRRHNACPGATVIQILKNFIALDIPVSDPELLSETQQMAEKFSWVPREYLQAALEICHAPNDALDIIRILGDHFEKPAYLKYDISYSLAASEATASSFEPVQSQKSKATSNARSQADALQTATANVRAIAELRDRSVASATAAYRKGRSNPLYRQAGAFYAERARGETTSFHRAISVEANLIVDQQSSYDKIDLHNVGVQDAVNIALDRTRKWWDGLGEDRARKAKLHGLTVVTGWGRHSVDGRSKLRSHVPKALVADGWKIEVYTGHYLVTGRQ